MKIDVLIIGGGPGGSAAAMFLLREGIKPVILEQEEFPRFHIGESLTGEAAQVLRRLGLAEKMDAMANPIKAWGEGLRNECDQQLVCEGLVAGSRLETIRLDDLAGPAERIRHDDAQGSGGAGRDDHAGRRDRRAPEC